MFYRAYAFDQDIGDWDTYNVKDMAYMFCLAWAFNQDLSGWRVDKITDMSSMFHGALAFDQDIGAWDTSGVRNMQEMFYEASAFNQDLGWCVDDNVEFDPWGGGKTFQDAFYRTPCESTSCGVVQMDTCATPPPTPQVLPTNSLATLEGSMTCAGISLADAESNAGVYASAVADVYDVQANRVTVTFSSGRRRLQSGSIVVDYTILYATMADATAVLMVSSVIA